MMESLNLIEDLILEWIAQIDEKEILKSSLEMGLGISSLLKGITTVSLLSFSSGFFRISRLIYKILEENKGSKKTESSPQD